MSVRAACKGVSAALAVVVGVLGLLISPPPARALDCAQPIFSGPFNLRQSNGFRVETDLRGDSAEGQAVAIGANGSRTNGRVKGNTFGGAVTLEINWDGGAYAVYTGSWDGNGFVHGNTYDGTRARVSQATWDSETPLVCPAPPAPEESYVALFYSPEDFIAGAAWGIPTQEAALINAQRECERGGGRNCVRLAVVKRPAYIVLAVIPAGPFSVATGTDQFDYSALDRAILGLPSQAGRVGWTIPGDSVIGSGHRKMKDEWPQITLRYDPPTPLGIRAWVGITLNEDRPPMGCTYSDGVFPLRPFTVTGSAETPIDIFGFQSGRVYDVTVKCDNGLTHTEQKQF